MEQAEPNDPTQSANLEALTGAFADQLMACLDDCARGRKGLFHELDPWDLEEGHGWPEAAQLRQLALALQPLLAQQEQPSALVDEFLDLCSMHGESHPGERRLARTFLERIERGEVGRQGESLPW